MYCCPKQQAAAECSHSPAASDWRFLATRAAAFSRIGLFFLRAAKAAGSCLRLNCTVERFAFAMAPDARCSRAGRNHQAVFRTITNKTATASAEVRESSTSPHTNRPGTRSCALGAPESINCVVAQHPVTASHRGACAGSEPRVTRPPRATCSPHGRRPGRRPEASATAPTGQLRRCRRRSLLGLPKAGGTCSMRRRLAVLVATPLPAPLHLVPPTPTT